jgi:drug/metabolite transporter (DMT)-like permease
MGVSLKILVGVALYVGFAVAGDLLLSRGMKQAKPFREAATGEVSRFFRHIVTNACVLGGIACLALNFAVLLILLSWEDISLIGPTRAASYFVLTILAAWLLKERVTPKRWLGAGLVSAGVCLVLITSKANGETEGSKVERDERQPSVGLRMDPEVIRYSRSRHSSEPL